MCHPWGAGWSNVSASVVWLSIGPAFHAGLQAGDRILEVNGRTFLPKILLADAIKALTASEILMVTALVGARVPKHLYLMDMMQVEV